MPRNRHQVRMRAWAVLWCALGGAAAAQGGASEKSGAATPSAAPAPGGTESEFGAVAPANSWLVEGGSFARTGVADTAPFEGPVDVAWRFPPAGKSRGEPEGEPLVWGDAVFVCFKEGPKKRTLIALDLRDGRATAERSFTTDRPLAPCLYANLVVLRAAPDRLEAWRLVGGRLESTDWSWTRKGASFSGPIFLGREIYVRADDSILRLGLFRGAPLWEKRGSFAGDLALRGGHVYVAARTGANDWRLAALARADGAETSTPVKMPDGRPPPTPQVFARRAVLWTESARGEPYAAVALRDVQNGGAPTLAPKGEVPGRRLGWTAWRDGLYFGVTAEGLGASLGWAEEGDPTTPFVVVASSAEHPEFVPQTPLATSADAVLIGGRAFDARTSRILWSSDVVASARPVPARRTVLLVEGGVRLAAVRPRRGAAPSGGTAADSRPKSVDVARGRAALADGSSLAAPFVLDHAAGVLVRDAKPKAERVDLADVLLVEDENGTPTFVASPAAVAAAAEAAAERIVGETAARLAFEACLVGDVELAETLLNDAVVRGATGGAAPEENFVKRAFAKLAGFDGKRKAVDEAKRADLRAQRAAADDAAADALVARAAALRAKRPWAEISAVLRAAAARRPAHAGLLKVLDDAPPKGWPHVVLPDSAEEAAARTLDRLAFADAAAFAGVRVVGEPPAGGDATGEQRELGSERTRWRKDLRALASRNLLLLTPLATPGRAAECLAHGERACEVLEELFGGTRAFREPPKAMKILLCGTQEEYAELSAARTGASPDAFQTTAGHYVEMHAEARFFATPVENPFQTLRDVYVHELTHAWIAERCALVDLSKRGFGARVGASGFWIVEGLATFVQHLDFAPGRPGWADRPRALPLDFVAHAKKRLPWKAVFVLNQNFAQSLNAEAPMTALGLSGYLGLRAAPPAALAYYWQAAAACHYLWFGEGGALRPRLFEFVARYYNGKTGKGTLEEVCGCDAEEFGARIVAHARRQFGE